MTDAVRFTQSEVVTYEYLTETHQFKIKEDTLESMRKGKDFLLKIGTKIQKQMKQISEKSNGREWQASYEKIFEYITDQKIIKHGLVPQ